MSRVWVGLLIIVLVAFAVYLIGLPFSFVDRLRKEEVSNQNVNLVVEPVSESLDVKALEKEINQTNIGTIDPDINELESLSSSL